MTVRGGSILVPVSSRLNTAEEVKKAFADYHRSLEWSSTFLILPLNLS